MMRDQRSSESGEQDIQGPADRRVAALKAAAEAKRLETIEATRKAVQRLKSAGVEITAKTLAEASGRSFRTILRNKDAYELYRQSASHFKKTPSPGKPRVPKPSPAQSTAASGESRYDPLMDYPKSKLVQRQRALEARIDELEHELAQVAIGQQQVEEHNLALQAALKDSNTRLVKAVSEQVRKLIALD